MGGAKHDKLAQRLAMILERLNEGACVRIEELAEEFGVSTKTIQRDLFERFAFLPLKKEDECYKLEEYYLGKLSFKDIQNFALLSGVRSLFPKLDKEFLRELLDGAIASAYMIRGCESEKIEERSREFFMLQEAILEHLVVEFEYRGKKRRVQPYKLSYFNGFWYLIGIEEKIKTFMLSKIKGLRVTKEHFEYQAEVAKKIESEDDIFFDSMMIDVVLEVDNEVAHYFKVKKIVPYQEILKETKEGLIVSSKVAYDEVLLSIVRYWIPHVRIISPKWMQERLIKQLQGYINAK